MKTVLGFYAALIVFFLGGFVLWSSENFSMRGEDVPNHLSGSIGMFYRLSDDFARGGITAKNMAGSLFKALAEPPPHMAPEYPNTVYIVTSFLYRVFGTSLFSARMSNIPYAIILFWAVFVLGRELHSRACGIVAAGITGMLPMIFESSRQYGLDFPATAITALSLALLVKSRGLHDRTYSILFGLAAGIGMCVKGQVILFILPPLAYIITTTVYQSFRAPDQKLPGMSDPRASLFTIIVPLGLILLFSSVWIAPRFADIMHTLHYEIHDPLNFGPPIPVFLRPLFHVFVLAYFSTGLLVFFLFLLSTVSFLKSNHPQKSFYLLWFFSPFFILSFIFWHQNPRHFMPAIPVVALTIAWFLVNIPSPGRRVLLAITPVILAAQFFALSFGSQYPSGFSAQSHHPGGPLHAHTTRRKFPIFGGTDFGDIRRERDKDNVPELFAAIDLKRRPRVLFVSLTRQAPDPFKLYYYSKLLNRSSDIVELNMMHRYAYHHLTKMDAVVFFLPGTDTAGAWPSAAAMEILLDQSADPYSYCLLQNSGIQRVLFEELYRQRSRYSLMALIRAPSGYTCALYGLSGHEPSADIQAETRSP